MITARGLDHTLRLPRWALGDRTAIPRSSRGWGVGACRCTFGSAMQLLQRDAVNRCREGKATVSSTGIDEDAGSVAPSTASTRMTRKRVRQNAPSLTAAPARAPGSSRLSREQRGVQEYRERMRQAGAISNLDVWYAHIEIGQLVKQLRPQVDRKRAREAEKTVAKTRTRDSMQAFSKADPRDRRRTPDHQRSTDRADRGSDGSWDGPRGTEESLRACVVANTGPGVPRGPWLDRPDARTR
jgi:hypothetical protein